MNLPIVFAIISSGCSGIVTSYEKTARESFQKIGGEYSPERQKPPEITEKDSLENLIKTAVMRSPEAEAAYYDWASYIEKITVERSLPDPRLTFEADIQSSVMALMPGLMVDFPGPGKLRARAEVAAEEANVKYAEFRKAALKAAGEFKNAYYDLQAIKEAIEITRNNLSLVQDLKEIAKAQYESGKVSLQDLLRAEIEEDELKVRIENLADSEVPIQARYKASLGINPVDTIAFPAVFTNTLKVPPLEEIYNIALGQNPVLKKMEAEIRRAEGAVTLARKSAVPDFMVGAEVDVKPSKPIIMPKFSVTLPIWRDKIRAEIESALSQKKAAEARYSQEELNLAVEFAAMAFMFRESEREYRLLNETLIPKARQSFSVAQSGYVGGISSFVDYIEAERLLLKYELSKVEAIKNRERSLTNLSFSIAGIGVFKNIEYNKNAGGENDKGS